MGGIKKFSKMAVRYFIYNLKNLSNKIKRKWINTKYIFESNSSIVNLNFWIWIYLKWKWDLTTNERMNGEKLRQRRMSFWMSELRSLVEYWSLENGKMKYAICERSGKFQYYQHQINIRIKRRKERLKN